MSTGNWLLRQNSKRGREREKEGEREREQEATDQLNTRWLQSLLIQMLVSDIKL